MTDPRSEAIDVVRRFEDALQQQWAGASALDMAMELLDPDVEVIEAESLPYAGTWRGHDGFRALADIFAKTWEFPPGKTFDFIGDDRDRVVVITEGRVIARATGREMPWRLAEMFTVRDGLITEIRPYYWDTAGIAAAVTP